MNIEIHQPELEAMILQRIDSGAFDSIEDMLMQALKSLPASDRPSSEASKPPKKTLAQFLVDSPLPGSGLNVERIKDYPQPVEL